MSTLTPLLVQECKLHRALNSACPPADLEEKYAVLHQKNLDFRRAIEDLIGMDTHYLTFHDNFIQYLSERRRGTIREVSFSVQVCAYLKENISQHQHAPVQARLIIPATASLRGLSNRVVYTTLIDQNTQTIGFVVHPNNGQMTVVEAPYDHIEFTIGALTD